MEEKIEIYNKEEKCNISAKIIYNEECRKDQIFIICHGYCSSKDSNTRKNAKDSNATKYAKDSNATKYAKDSNTTKYSTNKNNKDRKYSEDKSRNRTDNKDKNKTKRR